MCIEDFVSTLPEQIDCPYCHRMVPGLEWSVGRAYSGFMGICIAKCEHCKRVKIAAAGSDEQAHQEAQSMRARLIAMTGL